VQQECHLPLRNFIAPSTVVVALVAAILSGCSANQTTVEKQSVSPFSGQKLTIGCSKLIDPQPVARFAREWSILNDSSVELRNSDQSTDIAIVTMAELPALAESGQYLPVPPALLDRGHAYQRDNLLPIVGNLFATWRKETFGIPLRGEGFLLAYRPERLAQAGIQVPQTWDEFAAAVRKLGPGSLPPLPATPDGLMTQFNLIASSYDQRSLQQGDVGIGSTTEESADRLFSFMYRLGTSKPRIDAPAFVHAFELMHAMQRDRSMHANAFADGTAAVAIVTLSDIARLQQPTSPVRGKFQVAPLPGARFTFDLDTGEKQPADSDTVNRLPYVGADVWVGLVSKSCPHPEVAFEFLAAFAHPTAAGTELITAARWGAGPLRTGQLEDRDRGLWFGFDLPPDQTERMIAALKQNTSPSVINHRYPLRLPNQREHLEAFDRIVRPALSADSADAKAVMREAAQAWEHLWWTIPAEKRREWIQASHGL